MKIWSLASQMAAQTPAERNRYVDFLRSVSILVVIIGHWLIATAYIVDGDIEVGHLLAGRPRLHWLTWLFQVMPIFFIVGVIRMRFLSKAQNAKESGTAAGCSRV